MAFPAGRGIDGQAACGSRRVQQKLYRFRAGAEGLILWLKRALQLERSRWKGEQGFRAYAFAPNNSNGRLEIAGHYKGA